MYSDSEFFTPPHVDHDFPHKNFILYLTQPSSGGNLKIYKNKKWNTYQVKEDEAIIFEGMHCHSPVTTPGERRVAIVATFI
jgi:hypothetical protein